jgi:hypothetical protein
MVDGEIIGSIDWAQDGRNGAALRIDFNDRATRERVELLVETLKYQNTSDTPAESRTIEITINDGDGTANGGDDTSDPDRVEIRVNAQNDAPELSVLDTEVSFDENRVNDAPRTLETDFLVSDADSADFNGGFIRIEYDQSDSGTVDDNLSFPDLMDIGRLDATDDGLRGRALQINLGFAATPASVQALLETLQYQNTSDDPAATRTISITIGDNDGDDEVSEARDIRIHVTPQNDVPEILDFVSEATFDEMGPPTVIDDAVRVIDPEIFPA